MQWPNDPRHKVKYALYKFLSIKENFYLQQIEMDEVQSNYDVLYMW